MWCEGERPKPAPEGDACRVKQESLEEPCTEGSTEPDQPTLTANRTAAPRAHASWKEDFPRLRCLVDACVTSGFCLQEMNHDMRCQADSQQDASLDHTNPPRPR